MVWNMIKVKNKNIKTTAMRLLWSLYWLGYCIMSNFCKAYNTTKSLFALLWDLWHNFKQTTYVFIVSLLLSLNVFNFPAATKKLNKICTFFFFFIHSRKNSSLQILDAGEFWAVRDKYWHSISFFCHKVMKGNS